MKTIYLSIILFSIFQFAYSQEGAAFKESKKLYLQGNSILIGNNILGNHSSQAFMNLKVANDAVKMKYIDVDDDPNTFSSSEASIINAPENFKIAHAALYWSALYPFQKSDLRESKDKLVHVGDGARDSIVNSILFKTPNGTYKQLTGEVIFDSYLTGDFSSSSPYVCYADVTKKLQDLETLQGKYTVANIKATEGKILGGGSAGWLLYIIYEDESESPKYFSTYNGLLQVNEKPVNINFKDFKSKVEGEFKTFLALGAMEGDGNIKTDKVSIFNEKSKKYRYLSTEKRHHKNFFNSSITINDTFYTDRNPNNANTLGFDLLKMEIPNDKNDFLDNASTQIKLKFETKKDHFYLFFVAIETEINKDFLEEKIKTQQDQIVNNNSIVKVSNKTEEKLIEDEVSAIEKQEKLASNKQITLTDEEIMKDLNIESISISGVASGYYLITNVFSVPENASKWSRFLFEKKYSTNTFINPENNWSYVYVANNKDLNTVYKKLNQYKDFEYFKKIWILKINL